ncbi:hypothetical protein AB3Y40_05570 [Yoonia sp. R2331]|uniref:hypothetical protein n=1 Tax=Yoonia sp. R2331 TaxID=3237238 RepID=UPI0034E47C3A
MRFTTYVLTVLALAGCSTGGSNSGTLSRSAQAADLEETLSATNITNPATLPTTGSTTYQGFMTAGLPTGAGGARTEYLGDLTMNVDFAASRDQVTGTARNFAAGNDQLTGVLIIRQGDLFRNTNTSQNFTFTGDVNGTLKQGVSAFVIDAEIAGEFRGRDQEGVSGLLFGDVTGPAGQDIFDGTFFAATP